MSSSRYIGVDDALATLPAHRELVYASGVAEIAGGAGLLHERTRRPAGWWLLCTLAAVFPANLHMALNAGDYPRIPPAAVWARLSFQLVFAALVRRAMRQRSASSMPS